MAKKFHLNERGLILTLIKSKVLVSITMQLAFSCQTILQKSVTVFSVGPCVTIYAFGFSKLCNRHVNIRQIYFNDWYVHGICSVLMSKLMFVVDCSNKNHH